MASPLLPSSEQFEHDYWRSAPEVAKRLHALPPDQIPDDQFCLLAENIPTLCWIANGDGYIVWYNRRWHDYCGTKPAEMQGWSWQSVHDPMVLPAVMERDIRFGWKTDISKAGGIG